MNDGIGRKVHVSRQRLAVRHLVSFRSHLFDWRSNNKNANIASVWNKHIRVAASFAMAMMSRR